MKWINGAFVIPITALLILFAAQEKTKIVLIPKTEQPTQTFLEQHEPDIANPRINHPEPVPDKAEPHSGFEQLVTEVTKKPSHSRRNSTPSSTIHAEDPKSVYLLFCFSADFESPALLKHFLEHYLFLGIPPENFITILNSRRRDNPKLIDIEATLNRYNVSIKKWWIGEYLPRTRIEAYEEALVKAVGFDRSKWVLTADAGAFLFLKMLFCLEESCSLDNIFADEFHVFHPHPTQTIFTVPIPNSNETTRELMHFLYRARERGKTAIMGRFVDRLKEDCSLEDIKENSSIWFQFPRKSRISRNVLRGNDRKILAHMAHLRTSSPGHHMMANATFLRSDGQIDENGPLYSVHHFKWNPTVIPKLRSRAETYSENHVGYEQESLKFLAYYEKHHRVC